MHTYIVTRRAKLSILRGFRVELPGDCWNEMGCFELSSEVRTSGVFFLFGTYYCIVLLYQPVEAFELPD